MLLDFPSCLYNHYLFYLESSQNFRLKNFEAKALGNFSRPKNLHLRSDHHHTLERDSKHLLYIHFFRHNLSFHLWDWIRYLYFIVFRYHCQLKIWAVQSQYFHRYLFHSQMLRLKNIFNRRKFSLLQFF
jgi:hypothetical protein